MIEKLLPAGVACVEAYEDVAVATLYPAEAALVAKAVQRRQQEYATVRHCARQALGRLGLPPAPILRGERGAPQWPDGVVGSMTHCDGYRAAAVARVGAVPALGIDAEPHQVLPDGVLGLVALPGEVAMLADLAAEAPEVCWDRLLFSAKEAVYKAWYPLARRWLGFEEASLALAPEGAFTATLLVPGPPLDEVAVTGFAGRWLVSDGLVVTAVSDVCHSPAS